MTSTEMIPATILKRKAVVYVRQSTQSQVMTNLEGQRRQYDLVDVARQRGFIDVESSMMISVDQPAERWRGLDSIVWSHGCAPARSAPSYASMHRGSPGTAAIGITFSNCVGLSKPRVIDLDGVYNPCRPNDRLLLGMKGSISEFELGVLRARMIDAARSKASRGELRLSVPFGYIWHREAGLGLDPDLRLQEVIRLIFTRFRELGSGRQVLLSMKPTKSTSRGPPTKAE